MSKKWKLKKAQELRKPSKGLKISENFQKAWNNQNDISKPYESF